MSGAIELDDITVETISEEAIASGRTMEQQIVHWITLGRAIEKSANFHFSAVEGAMRGTMAVERLSTMERAVFNEFVLAALARIDSTAASFFEFRLTKAEGSPKTADAAEQPQS